MGDKKVRGMGSYRTTLLLLVTAFVSTFIFGQNTVTKYSYHTESTQEVYYVIRIKDYEVTFEDSLQNGFEELNPNWIKSIEIIKSNIGFPDNQRIILIKLENRKWKKLPIELQKQFNLENED